MQAFLCENNVVLDLLSVRTDSVRTDYNDLVAKKKSKAASDLASERWKKTSPEKRSEIARELNEARWGKKTEEERKAQGERLAKARAAKRKQVEKKSKALR
jgi:hypothetical protein